MEAPLVELGLDSLALIELSYEVDRQLGLPLDPRIFSAQDSLEHLAVGLAGALDRDD